MGVTWWAGLLLQYYLEISSYLYRDEVCLAFIGYCFSKECLTATRWTIKKDALAWSHAKLQEFFRMLYRILGGGGREGGRGREREREREGEREGGRERERNGMI